MPAYPYFPKQFETQNFQDDDAEVINELVQQAQKPADIHDAVVPSLLVPQFKAIAPTRLFANTIQFSQAQQAVTPYTAVRLLSEDVNRGTCRVRVYSSATTPGIADYILVSDDLSKISAGVASICTVVRPSTSILDLDGHTGQVWVIPGPSLTASSVLEVSAFGITAVDGSILNHDR